MDASEAELSSSNEASTSKSSKPETSKKKKYLQKYKKEWETIPEFSSWLRKGKKTNHANCIVCNREFNIGLTGKIGVARHFSTDIHIKNAVKIKSPSVAEIFKNIAPLQRQVKCAELRMAAFISENNLAYSLADALPGLFNAMFPDSTIAMKINCGRTKTTALIKNVLGQTSFQELVQILKETKFSLIIDESTDVSTTKHLCLLVRYFDNNCVIDQFFALVPLKSSNAETIYKKIVQLFEKYLIPYKDNLIGFASDGASTMVGKLQSVTTLLKKDIPFLFTMKCICHSFNLCASNACLKLPRATEDLCRDIYNYFSNSPKRVEQYKEFQIFTNTKIHKLLHPAQTRWLSLIAVVQRVLEQYEALKLFFIDAAINDRILAAESILQKLHDPTNKIFLEFLEFVLPFFTNLNKEMQSTEPKIHILHRNICAIYKTILQCFIKPSILKIEPLNKINFKNPANYITLEEIYLGAKVSLSLNNLTNEQQNFIRLRCLDFYVESVTQINKRYNFDNIILQKLSFLDPKVIINGSVTSIVDLASQFPNIVDKKSLQALDNEFRLLLNYDHNLLDSKNETLVQFWLNIKNIKYSDNSSVFPLLSEFVTNMLILPHSSANIERLFSQVNLIKTKQRNKLNTKNITNLLHTKSYLRNKQKDSTNFVINDKMLNIFDERIYENSDSDYD